MVTLSPHDSRVHRYFPDFYIKVQENAGKIKRYLIEVKPLKQTTKPKKPKRQTKGYIREAFEYARNQANGKQQENTVRIECGKLK